MPFAAARSRERNASTVTTARSEESPPDDPDDPDAPDDPDDPDDLSARRALTIKVFTSDRTERFRTVRRAPARACFFAEAVRLATRHHQVGVGNHEFRIIGRSGI